MNITKLESAAQTTDFNLPTYQSLIIRVVFVRTGKIRSLMVKRDRDNTLNIEQI